MNRRDWAVKERGGLHTLTNFVGIALLKVALVERVIQSLSLSFTLILGHWHKQLARHRFSIYFMIICWVSYIFLANGPKPTLIVHWRFLLKDTKFLSHVLLDLLLLH